VARHQRERGLALSLQRPRTRTGRLRVGYLSGDFYDHPIAHLVQGIFGWHDRDHFEIFAYSFGPADDSVYRRHIIAGCEHFVDVADLSVPELARRIAADGIHLLVDLMGHTGINRLGALALRPAPVQVSFLGMLGTTGADFLDYLITDRTVTPPEFAADFTEKFVTLPHSYLIAEPLGADARPAEPEDRAALRSAHGLPERAFVYCSFNSTYKIEPRAFDVWMRILSRVPDSVLWLYTAGPAFEDNLQREAAAHGVDPGRLVFARFVPRPEHLRRHRAADLFLDTLLYNAAATASLALQAGLPVLTCPGDTFASRVGASLLHAVGMPELVASDVAEYERRAVELAQAPEALRQVSERLAEHLATAPLFDTARFVRNLERAYRAMRANYEAENSPRAIESSETEAGGK
jgi:predicted O-linked N-acetylglucosamine transferase (SPINDLY family)